MDNILILSPHTDDAELGCGGTIAKFQKEGKNILWLAFSTASESLPAHLAPDTLKNEFTSVAMHLGLSKSQFRTYDYKVRKLSESRQEILEELVKVRNEFKPDLVIGPSLNDYHQDHQVISNEMIRAFKTNASILCYELPWNHIEFKTQFFVQLDESDLKMKNEMLQFYKSQVVVNRHYFTKDFVNGIACTRGTQINTKYAEAFEVIRWRL
ncbi:MAG: GlcNAc-PI de-N-acetylase [Verrucomicrobia bacterium]|nr:GlcNAc-PI de-N-acetylase [Verrucomicrobiota bacterium]|tara:strand:+ start:40 stop:672 length:633 start_codon:yes stop_codon:yes gene_type:complete